MHDQKATTIVFIFVKLFTNKCIPDIVYSDQGWNFEIAFFAKP
jgi:hypothetical protein